MNGNDVAAPPAGGIPFRRRTYPELQSQGAAEIDAAFDALNGARCCPSCGHTWTGDPTPPPGPDGRPDRGIVGRRTRRHQLEPMAARLAGAVRETTTDTTFALWLSDLVVDDVVDPTIYIAAPGPVAGWVRDRFAGAIARAAGTLAGHPMTIAIYPDADAAEIAATLGELINRNICAPAPARRPDAGAPPDPSPAAGNERPPV